MTPFGAPFSAVLLAWYDREAADLPWRARPGSPPDPGRAYLVWLSVGLLRGRIVAGLAGDMAALEDESAK